ncbi:MAG: RNA polymerase sigma factor [Anaerolineales bacterium]|jgi:RNA polymerase sigma-70 factor (ECF subfamily)
MPGRSDDELLNLASNGDRQAFGLLYERYVSKIYSYVYYRTGNRNDAEDLTERVFYRALRHIGNYDNRGLPFSAWLYRIAHNLVANWHRDNSRRKEIQLDESIISTNTQFHPENEMLFSEEQQILMDLVRSFPPERQQLLLLKYVEHLSNAEIGKIMGRTEGAIKSLYHRTLLILREEMVKSKDCK